MKRESFLSNLTADRDHPIKLAELDRKVEASLQKMELELRMLEAQKRDIENDEPGDDLDEALEYLTNSANAVKERIYQMKRYYVIEASRDKDGEAGVVTKRPQ